jgi:glucosamine--fructose-6-phosphate aminotransferase (isomerizing)
MIAQIQSLSGLIREVTPAYAENIRHTLSKEFCRSIRRIYLTGCGDSHHASIGAELAFENLAGITTEALTSMQFARYASDTLRDAEHCLVTGASVSGEVSRTVEGLLLARKAGANVLALTASPASRIARAADLVVDTTQPKFTDPPGMIIPGVRSYVANLVGFLLLSIHFGEQREQLSVEEALGLRSEVAGLADAVDFTIEQNQAVAQRLAQDWADADEFVFCGSGPNFASALFSAAKILEATGDSALGQDMEEWAHLQYFAKMVNTPTFIISAAERDATRACEIVTAARAIGRRVAAVAPVKNGRSFSDAQAHFLLPEDVRELFSPVISAIPACLFAAYLAEFRQEPYFRGFGGGRSQEGGGGISRIRTSETLGLEYLK